MPLSTLQTIPLNLGLELKKKKDTVTTWTLHIALKSHVWRMLVLVHNDQF